MRPNRSAYRRHESVSPGARQAAKNIPASPLASDVDGLIRNHVERRMATLERNLVRELAAQGQITADNAASALSEEIERRVGSLERNAAVQLRELSKLQESSDAAESHIDSAAVAIQRILGSAVLLPPATRIITRQIATRDNALARSRYCCPNCSSGDICAAARSGFCEGFLRLFFIQPFRCRACSHGFFRF